MRAAFQLRYWILGLGFRVLGLYWDNGKDKGNYYSIWGLYCHNGKENGNYHSILGLYWAPFRPYM